MSSRILIVEDDSDIRTLLSIILGGAGYQVCEATNGPEALACLASDGIDLVILDIMLPQLNGWKICTQIRSTAETRHLPIIILTVRSEFHDPGKFEQSGANLFLHKPFEKEDLLNAVHTLLAASQTEHV